MNAMRRLTHWFSAVAEGTLLRSTWLTFRNGTAPFGVTILLISLCSTGVGQYPPCSVSVNVLAPDLSTLPADDAEAMVNLWKENIETGKYELPDGRWDWPRESGDFTAAMMHGNTASMMGGPSFIIMTLPRGGLPNIRWPRKVQVGELPESAFIAHGKENPVSVRSATIDRGPHRIIFVAENGKQMPEAARRIEAAVISDIVSNARAEDSFALLTSRGPPVEVRLGPGRDTIRTVAEQLRNPPASKSEGQGVLDTVLEATTWFQPPKPGDAIVLCALGLDSKHRVGFHEVLAAVAAGHVRVFGFEFAKVSQPDMQLTFPRLDSLFSIPESGFGNIDHLFALTAASGGWADQEDTEQRYQNQLVGGHLKQVKYQLTQERLSGLQADAESMYKAISDYYLLEIKSTDQQVAVGLTPSVLRQLPWVTLNYPHYPLTCPSVATATAGGHQ